MPGRAAWPSESLIPRYFGPESRPFLVDPPALVCAIRYILVLMSIADRYAAIKASVKPATEGTEMGEDIAFSAYSKEPAEGDTGGNSDGGFLPRVRALAEKIPPDVLIVGIVVLASSLSFGLGMLADRSLPSSSGTAGLDEKGTSKGVWVENLSASALPGAVQSTRVGQPANSASKAPKITPEVAAPAKEAVQTPAILPVGGQVVASKTGKAYYLPWCGGVKRIKDENKVWFDSAQAAQAAGYIPAKNCKGL